MNRFFARAVAVEEMPELETFMIMLAEYPDRDCLRLEFSIALSPLSGDSMDYPCIGTEMGYSFYGGITECNLSPRHLDLRLNDEASEAIYVDGGFHIEFDELGNEMLKRMENGIKKILARSPSPILLKMLP